MSVVIIFYRNLAFGIGAESADFFAVAGLAQVAQYFVSQFYGQGHITTVESGFVFGITEHDALVSGAHTVYAEGDVSGLSVEEIGYLYIFPVKSGLFITDVFYGTADCRFDFVGVRTNGSRGFSGNNDTIGRRHCFYCGTGAGIFFEMEIEEGVGNGIANLVGVAFGN